MIKEEVEHVKWWDASREGMGAASPKRQVVGYFVFVVKEVGIAEIVQCVRRGLQEVTCSQG